MANKFGTNTKKYFSMQCGRPVESTAAGGN